MTLLKTASCMALAGVAALPSGSALAADSGDFTAFASEHCNALIRDGRADVGFVLGGAAGKFSQAELVIFNQRFASRLVADYAINPAEGCVLDMVNTGTVKQSSDNKPQSRRNRQSSPQLERAIVSGVIQGKANAPVAVAYRMERRSAEAWEIANISLNGQPLAEQYREAFETLAEQGGAEAVLESLR